MDLENSDRSDLQNHNSSSNDISCPICLDDFSSQSVESFQNCSHSICSNCYANFILTSNRCPVCRSPIRDENIILKESLDNLNAAFKSCLDDINKLRAINSKVTFDLLRRDTPLSDDDTSSQATRQELIDLLTETRSNLTRLLNGSSEAGLFPVPVSNTTTVESYPIGGGLIMGTTAITGPLSGHLPRMSLSGMADNVLLTSTNVRLTGHYVNSSSHNTSPPSFLENLRNTLARFNMSLHIHN